MLPGLDGLFWDCTQLHHLPSVGLMILVITGVLFATLRGILFMSTLEKLL